MKLENNSWTRYGIAFALVSVLLFASLVVQIGAISSSNVTTYNQWAAAQDCTFTIFTDSTTTYAKNCDTGAITYSGTNASDIIENALSGGGKVVVKAGTYTITAQTNIPSYSTLQGEGIGKTIFYVGNSANILPFKNSDATNGNTNIVLRDFTLNINGANQGSNGWIALSGTSNSTIDGIEVKNPRTFSVLWQAIGDAVTGIHSKNNLIQNSIFSGGVSSNDRLVINIQYSRVTHNVFTGSPSGSNFDLSSGRSLEHVVIDGNIFFNSGQIGLGMEDPQYAQVINNNFYNMTSNCIQITHETASVNSTDVIVADNYMNKCGTSSGTGIRILDTYNLKVANNLINNTASGCMSVGVQDITKISNVQITGNQGTYCGSSGTTADGLSASGINNGVISHNIFGVTRRDGITTNALTNSIIANNVVYDFNKGGVADTRGSGIVSSGGSPTGNMITGNSIFYTSGNGGTGNRAIFFGTGDYNIAVNNRINGTYLASPAISIAGSSSISNRNNGFLTEAQGTGTINSGSTSATITHGLAYTPTRAEITITFGEDPTNSAGTCWTDTIGATTFAVKCENDPGASNLDFSWAVRKIS